MKKTLIHGLLVIGMIICTSAVSYYRNMPVKGPDMGISDQEKKVIEVKTVYTCPMHPEIVQEKPGKCPKCGMDLKGKEVSKDQYSCPMHPEVVQDKQGKCPKCGMNLTLKQSPKKQTSPQK